MGSVTASIKYGVMWFLNQPIAVYRAGKNTHPIVGLAGLVVSTPIAVALAVTVGLVVSVWKHYRATN